MLADLLDRVDKLKAELDAVRPLSIEDAQRLRAKLNLEWNFHSNAIEGNTLTLGETRAFLLHGITARGKPFKDYLDIKGHKAAIEHIEAIVHEEHPLTEADVRFLHELLLVEPYEMDARTPGGQPTKRMIQVGEYKSMPNSVRTSTGELHSYASPEETPALMGDLMAWYRKEIENPESHPVVVAALFHHRFVAIHPFDDGNGRMTRLLMNLILMQTGYTPIVIRNEQRDNYLLALSQADAGETEPFVEFIAELEIASLELTLQAARGESIDEPDDLDKRLSLLQKQIQGWDKNHEVQQQRSEKRSVQLKNSFLIPFLEILTSQLPKFKPFFQSSHSSVSVIDWNFEEIDYNLNENESFNFIAGASKHENINDVSQFSNVADRYLTEVEEPAILFAHHALTDFKKDHHSQVLISIMFDLRNEENFVCRWGVDNENFSHASSVGHHIFPNTLVDTRYDKLNFTKNDLEDKVAIITTAIVRLIENLSERE